MKTTMKTVESPQATAYDVEFDAAVGRAMKGIRDPKAMDEAARAMDEGREEIRSRLGELNIAVVLVRESRDE